MLCRLVHRSHHSQSRLQKSLTTELQIAFLPSVIARREYSRTTLATVSRYLPKRKPDHDQHQRWKTSLHNHSLGIAAMDFLVVPTARFQLLYVWFVIDHGRRIIIHFGVTAHPTSSWVVQQLRESAASIIATSGRKQLDHCDSLTGRTGPSPSGRIKENRQAFHYPPAESCESLDVAPFCSHISLCRHAIVTSVVFPVRTPDGGSDSQEWEAQGGTVVLKR